MTVKELIEELKSFEPDLPVLCWDGDELKKACISFYSRKDGEPFAVGIAAAE